VLGIERQDAQGVRIIRIVRQLGAAFVTTGALFLAVLAAGLVLLAFCVGRGS
jgi:hypothetical protein